jgi:hypothetical protein
VAVDDEELPQATRSAMAPRESRFMFEASYSGGRNVG